jgi:Phage integrase family
LSGQITDQVFAATGVRITAHQFRHAAAAILLRHRPGEYELVRRLLGHQSITTTTRFYTGLEALQATRLFGEIVGRELEQTLGPGSKAKKSSKAGQKAPLVGAGDRA